MDAVHSCGCDPVTTEKTALAAQRETLPLCAISVLDGSSEPTAEYWDWLRREVNAAKSEHDREYDWID